MIQIKRILFPNCNQEGYVNPRQTAEFNWTVRQRKLGKNLDSLGHLPELIRLQNTRKVRRLKRHREFTKSNTSGEQKYLQTAVKKNEVTTLPSRCIQRVMDSLASLGKVGRFQQQLTVSSVPVSCRTVHKPISRSKRKRLATQGVHNNTQRYLKGAKRTKTLVGSEVTASVESLISSTSGIMRDTKPSTSENERACTGLSAMFGIIAPLYSRSKKTGSNSEMVQKTCSHRNENSSSIVCISTSSSQSVESRESGSGQDIESEVQSATNVRISAKNEVVQAIAMNKEQRPETTTKLGGRKVARKVALHEEPQAETTSKHHARKASVQRPEHKQKESIDEPTTDATRRSMFRHDAAVGTSVSQNVEESKWNDQSSVTVPPTFQKQEIVVESKVAKLGRSIRPSSNNKKTSEFPLRRSTRVQSTQTQTSSNDCTSSKSSTSDTERTAEILQLDDSSMQRKGVSKTTVSQRPPKRKREIEHSRRVLRRSTRQIFAPDRLGDAAPVELGQTKRKQSGTTCSGEISLSASRQTDGLQDIGVDARIEDGVSTSTDSWTEMEIALLRKSHQEANPKSLTFWEDIAASVGSKSAAECRERWFSFVKTPAPHLKRSKVSFGQKVQQIGDDDIFNATPMRSLFQKTELGFRLDTCDLGGFLAAGSAIKVATKEHPNDMNAPLPSTKHGYKTYIKNVKRFVNQSAKCKLPKEKKQTKNCRAFLLQDSEGDFEVNGRLSPGGTLCVNTDVDELDAIDLENEDELYS